MFRSAAVRATAAAAAARAAPRAALLSTLAARATTTTATTTAARLTRPTTAAGAVTARRAAAALPVRWYSAGGGLAKDEVEGRIISLLQGFDKVNDASQIKGTSHFANDLGLDSLDTVEVVMAIEEEFSIEIPDKDADAIHSVDKAVEYILSQPDAH